MQFLLVHSTSGSKSSIIQISDFPSSTVINKVEQDTVIDSQRTLGKGVAGENDQPDAIKLSGIDEAVEVVVEAEIEPEAEAAEAPVEEAPEPEAEAEAEPEAVAPAEEEPVAEASEAGEEEPAEEVEVAAETGGAPGGEGSAGEGREK